MNAYSAFFSTARRNDERSNWINGKERERKTETKRKDESGAKTREGGRERERERGGHSQIIGYNGEGCDE